MAASADRVRQKTTDPGWRRGSEQELPGGQDLAEPGSPVWTRTHPAQNTATYLWCHRRDRQGRGFAVFGFGALIAAVVEERSVGADKLLIEDRRIVEWDVVPA